MPPPDRRRERLTAFTPLPPERNGIADYAAMLLGALAEHYDCEAACEDWLAEAPPGVAVLDPALAHRHAAGEGARVLHQLGNNPGHGFVLDALRRAPGVSTLHDPGLLHLRQTTGAGREALLAAALRDAPPAFARYARRVAAEDRWSRADHLLFDAAGEALARSRAVAVHSRFARDRLRALHGEAAAAHVEVIPHLLPPFAVPQREEARARLDVPPDAFLVCTAGFATAAKRFDWLLEALETVPAALWIHAGAERPEEFPLAAAVAERPALRGGRARIAGYLSEAALTDHVAAADALVNLRFPSAGESSGSLARGFAAGVCCVVSDTGAYAELPRDAVLHVPLAGAAPFLAEALAALAADPARARAVGEAGRRFALAEMALPAVALRYRALIEASRDRPPAAPPRRVATPAAPIALPLGPGLTAGAVARALRDVDGPCRLLLAAPDLEALADWSLERAALLDELLPPWAALRAVRVLDGPPRAGLLLDLHAGDDAG